jgi:membrane protease YdiL (CAAX protease family)
VSGLVFALVNWWGIAPLLQDLAGLPPPDISDFYFIRKHVLNYVFMLAIGWLVGGVYEELLFRGFMFGKLQAMFRDRHTGFWVSALITSGIFALYHWQLGVYGVVNAFIFTIPITALQYRYAPNLWYLVFFHGMYDTVGLTMIRYGW